MVQIKIVSAGIHIIVWNVKEQQYTTYNMWQEPTYFSKMFITHDYFAVTSVTNNRQRFICLEVWNNHYIHTYIKLHFIVFINVLISTEYKTRQEHKNYHKTITTKTQRQHCKLSFVKIYSIHIEWYECDIYIYIYIYTSYTYKHEEYNCGNDLWLVNSIIKDMKTLKNCITILHPSSYVYVYL
jgi:hypothetical protein